MRAKRSLHEGIRKWDKKVLNEAQQFLVDAISCVLQPSQTFVTQKEKNPITL
jgi:hypothetical protein